MAGQQWPRAIHRFAVREAGRAESGNQHRRSENKIEVTPGASLTKKDKYLIGLDVGSMKTCALIAEIDEEQVKFLGWGAAETNGLRKALIVHLSSTFSPIR